MGKLVQKVAVITGGARGIGRQMAIAFAAEGADIVIGDILEMDATAQEVVKLGRKVITVAVDVSKKAEVERFIGDAIKSFKKVDILVNNAGIVHRANLLEMTEDDLDRIFNVNLKGTLFCTQAVANHMMEKKYGKIINMASIAGTIGFVPKLGGYAASKAGIVQLTKFFAVELGCYGINVNAIAPALIITDITYVQRSKEEVNQMIEEGKKRTALGKAGSSQDIANLALFLASDDSSFITGEVISCNGGRLRP